MFAPSRADDLDPLQRAEFDCRRVRQWRITWPDGTSEVIEGHRVTTDGGVASFGFDYLGVHRYVNLQHVRDVRELSPEPEQ